ncbi:MAG: FecR domain-containing protein [Lewinella sp.]|nr:FecR domain-containing protein [Lewinella sp.]
MAKFVFYKNFEFGQFIDDPAFKQWVFSPTRKQDAFWKGFVAIYPEKEKAVIEAREFLLGTKKYFDQIGADEQEIQNKLQEVLDRASAKTKADPQSGHVVRITNSGQRQTTGKKQRFSRRWAIAASIALVLCTVSWFWFSNTERTLTYSTNYGEWKTVVLPDGSTVQLNANSELVLQKKWEEAADRKVYLKGEAFFNVAKKPKTGSKFIVVTSDLEIEVLGTAFNVHTRGEGTEVYLEEGAIKLEHGQQETTMRPGDFIAYSGQKEKITARHSRTDSGGAAPDAWKDGVIIFTNDYAFPILKKLEEIYGIEFEVNNEAIYSKKYTVAVPMEELKIVIPILKKSMQVEITVENNLLILE